MPLITIAMSEVPAQDVGLASGIANVSMQISAAIGLAALAAQGYALSSALTGGYQFAFGIAATCVALGLLVVLVVLRSRGRHHDAPVPRSEMAEGFAEAA